MAIKLNLTVGIDSYLEAYANIISQSSDNNADKTNFTYFVSVWASEAHCLASSPPIDRDRYEVVVTDLVTVDMSGLYGNLRLQDKYKDGVMT